MDERELITAIRTRIADPKRRIDLDTIEVPALFPPASAAVVDRCAAGLHVVFPALLVRLYREVGNGGFGPGAGTVGVEGGYRNSDGNTVTEAVETFRSDGGPSNFLPLWDWGGGGWSCVDCSDTEGRIVTYDAAGATRSSFTIESWMRAWVVGVKLVDEVFEHSEGITINPFTKQSMRIIRRGSAKGLRLRLP